MQCKMGKSYNVGVNNPNYGKHISDYHKQKISEANLGENNGMWKGYNHNFKSLASLHTWVRKRLLRPDKCPVCKIKPVYDLANITGVYSRDLENWQYQCRSCHMKSDYSNGIRKQ